MFFLPFFLLIAVELFVLPINFFTFRPWETLIIRKVKMLLPGFFYPNMRVEQIEQGDIAPYSAFSVMRKVEWQTDRYGYRKRNTSVNGSEIVIIGDSMIGGVGLTQKDLLSEVLEQQSGVSVYPYAPRRVSDFLKESRFFRYPPDVVIFETAENLIPLLDPLSVRQRNVKEPGSVVKFFRSAREIPCVQSLGIFLDRIYKANMLNYLRAQLRRKVSTAKPRYHDRAGPMLFLMGTTVNKDIPKEQIIAYAQIIEGYCRTIQKRGIRFIFLPIPTKENIYHDLLPNRKRPVNLDRLISEMKKRGVETVNLQQAFAREYHKKGTLLYRLDDTHWNGKGVRIAADLIEQTLKKGGVLHSAAVRAR
jgi:alginate O-acetyltransferase complex protein AlgJ